MVNEKKVNIYSTVPLFINNNILRGNAYNVTMSVSSIRACINARAAIDEILDNGQTLRLNLSNYDKDNNAAVCMMNDACNIVEKPQVNPQEQFAIAAVAEAERLAKEAKEAKEREEKEQATDIVNSELEQEVQQIVNEEPKVEEENTNNNFVSYNEDIKPVEEIKVEEPIQQVAEEKKEEKQFFKKKKKH